MMDRKEFDAWVADNGTRHISRKYINGINYAFVTMKDGWIAIFEVDDGSYIPKIQAKDEKRRFRGAFRWSVYTCLLM